MIARLLSLGCVLASALAAPLHAQSNAELDLPYATVSVEPETTPVREMTGDDDAAAAESFMEGRGLLKQGKHAEACRAFERSRQLNTTVGVLLNLGLCHRELGRLATAHSYYRRAEVLATLNGDPRGELAHEAAAELASRRATVTFSMSEATDDLEVRIDSVLQPSNSWAQPMFIDSGAHIITIQAPNRPPWHGNLFVQDGGQHVVVVPALALTPNPHVPEPKPAEVPVAALEPEPASGLGTRRVVALGIGGAGLVSLGTGLLFGLAAQNTYADSDAYCQDNDLCEDEGVRLRQDAKAHATRATVLTTAGVIALAGGVIVWLTEPERERTRAELARRWTHHD